MESSKISEMLTFDKNNKYHRWIRTGIITILSLIVFVLLWWDISLLVGTAAIPTPWKTWDALVDLFTYGDLVSGYTMWDHIWVSLKRFLLGLLISLLVAVPIGLLLGYSPTLKEFSTPALELLRPIAPIAWAPIFLFAIGYTWGPIMVVFVGIFFPLLTNTIFGVQKIDSHLVDAAKTLGASKLQVFYKIMFPCAVPYVMNGIRIGSGIGWMCIVASELYAASGGGIGYFVGLQASLGFWPNVYAGIIIIAILGIVTTSLFDYIYKVITKRMGME